MLYWLSVGLKQWCLYSASVQIGCLLPCFFSLEVSLKHSPKAKYIYMAVYILLPSCLFFTGLHRWEHGHGVVPLGSWCQREPTWQWGMDAAACCCLLWPSWNRRVRSSYVSTFSRFLPLCGHQSAKCGAKVFLQLNNTNIVFLFGNATSQLKREQACLVHGNMKLLFLLFSCLFSL